MCFVITKLTWSNSILRVSRFSSSCSEYAGLQGCSCLSLDEYIPTFRRDATPTPSGSNLLCLTAKVKPPQSFERSRSTCPTQLRFPEVLHPSYVVLTLTHSLTHSPVGQDRSGWPGTNDNEVVKVSTVQLWRWTKVRLVLYTYVRIDQTHKSVQRCCTLTRDHLEM